MAGTNPGFDGDAFRAGIQFAMEMGAPPDEENRATFIFPSRLVYEAGDAPVDDSGVPFDAAMPVRRETPPSVRDVACAVEYFDERGMATNLGDIHATRVRVTLLDEDYRKVEGCEAVILGGDRYVFRRMEPPSGLFDVGLFMLWFHAEQEV